MENHIKSIWSLKKEHPENIDFKYILIILLKSLIAIKTMEQYGYEIKLGKNLSFRHKEQGEKGRFIRAKETTLVKDYTNEKSKERIKNNINKKFVKIDFDSSAKVYKKVDNLIDLKNNKKI